MSSHRHESGNAREATDKNRGKYKPSIDMKTKILCIFVFLSGCCFIALLYSCFPHAWLFVTSCTFTFLSCVCYFAFPLFCCVIIVLHFTFKCFVCFSLSSIHIHVILFYSIQNIPWPHFPGVSFGFGELIPIRIKKKMHELFRNILGITCTNVCLQPLTSFSSVLLCHYCLAFHI